MPIDFSPLQQIDPAGAFYRGQEATRSDQERNMMRQFQIEQAMAQRENMLAQRGEREALAAERRRATETQNALAGYVRGGMPQGPEGLLQFGEAGVKTAKELRDMRAGELEQERKLIEYAAQRLNAATAETYPSVLADIARVSPKMAQNLPPQFDEKVVRSIAAQGMAIKDQLDRQEKANKPVGYAPGTAVYMPGETTPKFTVPKEPPAYTPSADTQGYELAKSEGFKGTFFDFKRQLAEAGRAPAQPRPEPAPRTQQVTMSDGTLGVMNMDTGQITPASLGGAPVKGKPSAFAEKTAGQRKQLGMDLDRAITELTAATKDKGLIDQSTGSGLGRGVDIGAGFFGQATPGAIAAGKLAPIADMVLKMVPRFEGPQSDKDTRSYKEAAGQLADSSLPNAIRKQAGLEIVRLMKARKNEFVTADMATEGVGAAPATAAPAGAGRYQNLSNDELLRQLGVKPGGR